MISVIIPMYNAEQYIQRCLNSIIRQTVFEQLEVIIVNDGSDDNSEYIVKEYTKKYSNIICYHTKNRGVSHARNIGLDKSNGEYVVFVDSDDYIDEEYISKLVAYSNDCSIVCSGFIAEYKNKRVKNFIQKEQEVSSSEAIHDFLIGKNINPNVWSKAFKRSVIEKIRFDESKTVAEDRLFLFYCLANSKSIKYMTSCGYHYTINEQSIVRSKFSFKNFQSILAVEEINKKIAILFPEHIDVSESLLIDSKCRIYADMYRNNVQNQFSNEYKILRNDIKNYSIIKKIKTSNLKHSVGLISAKISPRLYNFIKHNFKFQYK